MKVKKSSPAIFHSPSHSIPRMHTSHHTQHMAHSQDSIQCHEFTIQGESKRAELELPDPVINQYHGKEQDTFTSLWGGQVLLYHGKQILEHGVL